METSTFSFTALYTGETWAAHGLSIPELRTPAGDLMYKALGPMEWASKRLFGTNLRQMLIERHTMIDRLLIGLMEELPGLQVLEIACGLSARGCRFSRQFPELRYVEADLPQMAANKVAALARVPGLSSNHAVVALDILADGGPNALEAVLTRAFDRKRPLVVVTEGLMNYFPLPVVSAVWERLAEGLRRFPAAAYVTESYAPPEKRLLRLAAHMGAAGLRVVSRSSAGILFKDADEAATHLKDRGFDRVEVAKPGGANPIFVLAGRLDPRA
ncbi:class I SAM-dependent methyltransferase [Zavarzinia sp.]|uniref:class I SAM-dependent methyltransferase n=1 Tax=Zavarzinia sp. TaxID=2027920 RepID=UPI0035660296